MHVSVGMVLTLPQEKQRIGMIIVDRGLALLDGGGSTKDLIQAVLAVRDSVRECSEFLLQGLARLN